MINASEAKRRTQEVIENDKAEQMSHIESMVEDAISEGKVYVCWDGSLKDTVVTELRSLGYTVERYTQYNEVSYTISW